MGRAARQWRRTLEECERTLSLLPRESWIELRSGDLCREPAEALSQVVDFLGLESIAFPSDFRAIDHHILGNSMRLRSEKEIRLDETWRRTLTPLDLGEFQRVAEEANLRHGYGP